MLAQPYLQAILVTAVHLSPFLLQLGWRLAGHPYCLVSPPWIPLCLCLVFPLVPGQELHPQSVAVAGITDPFLLAIPLGLLSSSALCCVGTLLEATSAVRQESPLLLLSSSSGLAPATFLRENWDLHAYMCTSQFCSLSFPHTPLAKK